MGLLGVNCWGLSGLKYEFDRSWFLDQGYFREFLAASEELFPESGYRAEFYLGESEVETICDIGTVCDGGMIVNRERGLFSGEGVAARAVQEIEWATRCAERFSGILVPCLPGISQR